MAQASVVAAHSKNLAARHGMQNKPADAWYRPKRSSQRYSRVQTKTLASTACTSQSLSAAVIGLE